MSLLWGAIFAITMHITEGFKEIDEAIVNMEICTQPEMARAIGVPVCQALMKTQNPGSCKSAKYLVWCGYPAGLGSQLMHLVDSLKLALLTGRTLVLGAKSQYANPMMCPEGTLECYIRRLSNCTLEDALESRPVFKKLDVGNLQNVMSVCSNEAASYSGDRAVFVKARPWQMHNDSQPVYNGTKIVMRPKDRGSPLGGAYYYLHAPGRLNYYDQKMKEDHTSRSSRRRKKLEHVGLDMTSQFQTWVDRELIQLFRTDKAVIIGVVTAFVMRPSQKLWTKYKQFLVESDMRPVPPEQDAVGLHIRRGDKLAPQNAIEARFLDTAFFSSSCYAEVLSRFQIAMPSVRHVFVMSDEVSVSQEMKASQVFKRSLLTVHYIPTKHFHNFGNFTAARMLSAKLGIIDRQAAVGKFAKIIEKKTHQLLTTEDQDADISLREDLDEGLSLLASVMIMVLRTKVFIGASNGHVDILVQFWKTGLLSLGVPFGTFTSPVLLDMNYIIGAAIDAKMDRMLTVLPDWLIGWSLHRSSIPEECREGGYKSIDALSKAASELRRLKEITRNPTNPVSLSNTLSNVVRDSLPNIWILFEVVVGVVIGIFLLWFLLWIAKKLGSSPRVRMGKCSPPPRDYAPSGNYRIEPGLSPPTRRRESPRKSMQRPDTSI